MEVEIEMEVEVICRILERTYGLWPGRFSPAVLFDAITGTVINRAIGCTALASSVCFGFSL